MGGKNPLISTADICIFPVGFRTENQVVCQLPAQLQKLLFPGLGKITDGNFFDTMPVAKPIRQQIIDPIQVTGIVHMPVLIQIRPSYSAGMDINQLLRQQRYGSVRLVTQ